MRRAARKRSSSQPLSGKANSTTPNSRARLATVEDEEDGGSDSGDKVEREGDEVAGEPGGREAVLDGREDALAQLNRASALREGPAVLDEVGEALLDEDGVEDALRDGRVEESAVDEEDDGVRLGEYERDGRDEGCGTVGACQLNGTEASLVRAEIRTHRAVPR